VTEQWHERSTELRARWLGLEREDPEAAVSEQSNDFGQGASDRPGRGTFIPARVDERRPCGLGQGMAARWKNGADRQARRQPQRH
jgi:hypothetical protein